LNGEAVLSFFLLVGATMGSGLAQRHKIWPRAAFGTTNNNNIIMLPRIIGCYVFFCILLTTTRFVWADDRAAEPTPHHGVLRGSGPPRAAATAPQQQEQDDDDPTVWWLHNGLAFPLLGLGVGNLQHDMIPTIVKEGLRLGVRMIDTAHASRNEELITKAMAEYHTDTAADANDDDIHVVTKVWYTHLGYERTKYSVQESIDALMPPSNDNNSSNKKSKTKIHMLLHWPRCNKEIASWMDCTGEEDMLPAAVKALGPPPHLDPLAYLASWRALEELYNNQKLASIGVSNFDTHDLQQLLQHAKIVPHIIQVNVWSLFFDPELMELCRKHHIHVQVYNVMHGIFGDNVETRAPNALHRLASVAATVAAASAHNDGMVEDDTTPLTPVQLVLSWLLREGVSIIPRTTSTRHLHDNASVGQLLGTPPLTSEQSDDVSRVMEILLQRKSDLPQPHAIFVSRHDTPISLFWRHEETGQEHVVVHELKPGESYHSNTHPGHVFVAYESSLMDQDENDNNERSSSSQAMSSQRRREFQISVGYGDQQEIHIEL
jgi:diketogulonate reductase-like aldo/keto reductase